MPPIEVLETKKGLCFDVRVRPGSGRSAFSGEHDSALKVDLKSPPEEGKANKELIKIVASALGIKSADVMIASGETSRRKRLSVRGVDRKTLDKFLSGVVK